MKPENLEKIMEKRWNEMLKKYPHYNADFLHAKHKLLDWYEAKCEHFGIKPYKK